MYIHTCMRAYVGAISTDNRYVYSAQCMTDYKTLSEYTVCTTHAGSKHTIFRVFCLWALALAQTLLNGVGSTIVHTKR